MKTAMARAKNNAKAAKESSSGSQVQAQKAGLKFVCPSCKLEATNFMSMKQHYESKHPKLDVPSEEECKKG